MIYNTLQAILAVVFSLRAASFAVWQFKQGNFCGGTAVFFLAVSSAALCVRQLEF